MSLVLQNIVKLVSGDTENLFPLYFYEIKAEAN